MNKLSVCTDAAPNGRLTILVPPTNDVYGKSNEDIMAAEETLINSDSDDVERIKSIRIETNLGYCKS